MSHRKIHLLEKIQVELAIAAGLAVVYFWLQQFVRPWDAEAAIAFVPYGNFHQLAVLAAVVWVLAAGVAIVTGRSRPEGALAAVLIGAGGFSLRSPHIRTLMWLQEDGLRGMFGRLMIEVVLLTVVIIGAVAIISVVRRLLGAIHPRWVWSDPIEAAERPASTSGLTRLAARASEKFGKKFTAPQLVIQCATNVLLQSAIVIVLTMILLRSSDRGQIIFSLLAASLLGALLAHQFFPVPIGAFAWLAPMLIGIVFYVLAAVGAIYSESDAWVRVQLYARALPIDWLSAGAGGGVLGYWISERIHELRHMEKRQKDQADLKKAS